MCERFEFVGTVRDGVGGAARDTRAGIYLPDMLGFAPYPGSLNLDVQAAVLPALFEHQYAFAVQYAGTHRPMWHAFTADGQPCMIQWHSGMPKNVLEVFSPHHLRSRFGLTNGTPVTIRLAAVAELADATDSKSVAYGRAGSSPAGGTQRGEADG
jgi:CTP-dependent riboflavin kinase